MQVFQRLPSLQLTHRQAIVTVGNFDGVHRGHQQLIRAVVERAAQVGGRSVLVTFSPHPRAWAGECSNFYLSSDRERLWQFEQLGLDVAIVLPLTRKLRPDKLVDELATCLDMRELWIGSNFTLGEPKEGEAACLKQLSEECGFTLQIAPPLLLDGRPINARRIRAALREGEIGEANRCLGRPFQISGYVLRQSPAQSTPSGAILTAVFDAEHAVPPEGLYLCGVRYLDQGYNTFVYFGDPLGQIQDFSSAKIRLVEESAHLVGQPISLEVLSPLSGV